MWLWWLAAKITGPSMRVEMLAALDAHPREDPRERQDPGRQADAPERARRPATGSSAGKSTGSAGAHAADGRLLDERPQLRRRRALRRTRLRRCASETRLRAPPSARRARASSSPSSSSVVVGDTSARPAYLRDERRQRDRCPARTGCGAPPLFTHSRIDRALQLPRAFGARQLRLRPDERAPDPLMIRELPRWRRGRRRRDRRRDRATSTACTRSSPLRADGAPTTAESRTPGSWFSTRSTSSGKTFSPPA